MTSFRTFLKQSGLLPVETFDMPFLRQRVDSRHCISRSIKSLKFKALRRLFRSLCVPKTIRNCARIAGSTSPARATFPLFLRSPVEDGGKLHHSSQNETAAGTHARSPSLARFYARSWAFRFLRSREMHFSATQSSSESPRRRFATNHPFRRSL